MGNIPGETRQAALRLLDMWVLMKAFLGGFAEQRERIWQRLENPRVNQYMDDFLQSSRAGEDLFANGLIKLEGLYKKRTLAEQYNKYMNSAWKKLRTRDRTVLSVYIAEGENRPQKKDIAQRIGINNQRFSQCCDEALARLWGMFTKKKPCSHRNLSRLIYRWIEISGYSTQGNRRNWTANELEGLRFSLQKTGLPVFHNRYDACCDMTLPYIILDQSCIRSGDPQKPDGLWVRIVSEHRDPSLERKVCEILLNEELVFQRMHIRRSATRHYAQTVIEVPYEEYLPQRLQAA